MLKAVTLAVVLTAATVFAQTLRMTPPPADVGAAPADAERLLRGSPRR